MRLRLATRGSDQARTQSQYIADQLTSLAGADVELVLVKTSGDKIRNKPLSEIGGKGIFVKEVQAAVQEGRADLAVHSAKDLPSSWSAEGLVLASIPERRDPRDAIVGATVAELTHGATIATGSARRRVQLGQLRPDLRFVGLRGNLPKRVAAADEHDGVLMAVAGLEWIGMQDRIAQIFSIDEMIPQIGQGAMAIECRADDEATIAAVRALEHGNSRLAVDTERSFLAELGGGCELPVGAYASVANDGTITLMALIASINGVSLMREQRTGHTASIGAELAREMMSRGGAALLERQR
jgi:hydroxymethylbilane synthase